MPVHLTLEQAIGKNAYFEYIGRDGMIENRRAQILKVTDLEWNGRTFIAFWVKFERVLYPVTTAACWFVRFDNPLVNFTPDVLESFK